MLLRRKTAVVLLAILFAGVAASAENPRLIVSPDSLFFRQLTSAPPSSQTVTITVKGGTLGSVTATATSTGNWLIVSPANGTGITKFSVSASTTGLNPGEYSGNITITAQGFPSATVRVELEVLNSSSPPSAGQPNSGPPSALILRPDELEFHVLEGASPSVSKVEIFNPAGDSFSWTAAASVTTPIGGKWLTVTPLSGTGKGVLSVQADPTGLSAGAFKGLITVTSGSSTANVGIELDVDPAPTSKLEVVPQALNFNIDPNAAQPPQPRTLEVRSTGRGGTLQWTATAKIDKPASGNWLSINPTSGSTPGKITVKADPTGLSPGSYSAKVIVTSGSSSTNVQVFLRILGPGNAVAIVTPRRLKFSATTGTSGTVSPASRTVHITSTTSGLSFTAAATTAKGGAWLKISPASGPVPSSITASVDASIATALAPGFYTGSITVTVAGAAKAVNPVHVGLKVFDTGEAPRLDIDPAGVAFKATLGGPDPGAQQVTLEPEGAASLAWTATVSIASPTGGTWLSISPTSGTTTASSPSAVSASAKIAGLAAGIYPGTVVFTPAPATGAPPAHLRVMLVVAPSGAGKTASLFFVSDLAVPATPVASGNLTAFFTSPPDNFISDFAEPPDVNVTVLDSTGTPVSGATVTVSSSNGEPDLVLDDVGDGQYEGVFRALSDGPLTLTGSASFDTQTAPPFAVSGDIESSADLPTVIFQGGAVSAASFAPSPTPLAPGSLVSLFGMNVAGNGGGASSIPLPQSLGGVSVTIGGIPAPLLSADSNLDQINLQVPFELDGQAQADIVVNNNGVLSTAETVNIAVTPAFFTVSMNGIGPGAFLHGADFTPITSSAPASAGEVIVLFATGLGAVQPAVASGNATADESTVAANVTVTIGGLPAPVQFAGMAPNFVGLYQINVQVPTGVPSGDAQVVLSLDGTITTGQATVSIQ